MNIVVPFSRLVPVNLPIADRDEPLWSPFRCREIGIVFEAPFEMEVETAPSESPFGRVGQGSINSPFVFDLCYAVSRPGEALDPKRLSIELADRCSVDYDLASDLALVPLKLPGIEEAWALAGEVSIALGSLSSCWITLRKENRVASLGVTHWTSEQSGRDALRRLVRSIVGR